MKKYYIFSIIMEISFLPLFLTMKNGTYMLIWLLLDYINIIVITVKINISFRNYLKYKGSPSYRELIEESFIKQKTIIKIINKGGRRKYYDSLFTEEIKKSEHYKRFCELPRFQFANFMIVGIIMVCAFVIGVHLGFLS